jgi:hypothetical protein
MLVPALLSLTLAVSEPPSTQASPSTLTARERFGFVAAWSGGWREEYDIDRLGAGWYVEGASRACALSPGGMDRAALIQVRNYTGIPSWLGSRIDNHPGTIWLIGNEPDCIYHDNKTPEEYAEIYHELYTFIKDRDPTSQVSPGGIVQPTDLRLQWLDRVLGAYRAEHGVLMPVDVWNIHNLILREARGDWGCDIPPGINADHGSLIDPQETDSMAIFRDQIGAFRQWMKDNGYRNRPLIVTEYGILMPAEYDFYPDPDFDTARVNAFMSKTAEYFMNADDSLIGYPADGNRLVQRWAWFSLDWPPWTHDFQGGFNGNLFDPDTMAITGHGLHFAGLTSSLPSLDYVELSPGLFSIPPVGGSVEPGQTITHSVLLEILNEGTMDSGPFTARLEYSGPVNGVLEQPVENVPAASSRWSTFTLTDLQPGGYYLSAWIDSDSQVLESIECNNLANTEMFIPRQLVYLPLVAR